MNRNTKTCTHIDLNFGSLTNARKGEKRNGQKRRLMFVAASFRTITNMQVSNFVHKDQKNTHKNTLIGSLHDTKIHASHREQGQRSCPSQTRAAAFQATSAESMICTCAGGCAQRSLRIANHGIKLRECRRITTFTLAVHTSCQCAHCIAYLSTCCPR